MPHNHPHSHNEKNIKTAFFLNIGFSIAELFGGYLTNSVAILSDALHDLGDSLSLLLSWRLEVLSEKKEDLRYSYGYRRFSMLSALISAIVLITGSIFVIIESVERLQNPQYTSAVGMLSFALVGIAVNGFAAFRTSRGKNLNSQVISWHMIEDMLGWVAVLVVSIVLLYTDLYILDPVLSLIVTGFILFNVMKNLRRTLSLFLQAVPETIDIETFELEIKNLDMVEGIHHTHAWSLDGENHVLTTHVILCPGAKQQQIRHIKDKVREMAEYFGVTHTTVEFEYMEEDCSMVRNGGNGHGKPEKQSTK